MNPIKQITYKTIEIMEEEQENLQAVESPEWTEMRIKEEAYAKAHYESQVQEMEKQIAYSEKIALRQLKLESFKLASNLKPSYTQNHWGGLQQGSIYSVNDLLKDAELIYQSLIK